MSRNIITASLVVSALALWLGSGYLPDETPREDSPGQTVTTGAIADHIAGELGL